MRKCISKLWYWPNLSPQSSQNLLPSNWSQSQEQPCLVPHLKLCNHVTWNGTSHLWGGGNSLSAPSVSPVDVVACLTSFTLCVRNDGTNLNLLRVLPPGSLELQVYLLDSTICHSIKTIWLMNIIERAKRAHSLFMSIEISDIYIIYICSRSSRFMYPYTAEAPVKIILKFYRISENFNVCGSSRKYAHVHNKK